MEKLIVSSIFLLFVTFGWQGSSSGQEAPAPRGELRIVDKRSLFRGRSISRSVVETLMKIDHNGKLVPRLATGWRWLNDRTLELTLRHLRAGHLEQDFSHDLGTEDGRLATRLRVLFRLLTEPESETSAATLKKLLDLRDLTRNRVSVPSGDFARVLCADLPEQLLKCAATAMEIDAAQTRSREFGAAG